MFLLSSGVYAAVNTKDMEDSVEQKGDPNREKESKEMIVRETNKSSNEAVVDNLSSKDMKDSEIKLDENDSNFVQIELEGQSKSTINDDDCVTINLDMAYPSNNWGKDVNSKDTPTHTFNKRLEELDTKSDQCSDVISLNEPSCRICQSGMEEEALISPCRCCGSVKWIHESCLVHWMKSSLKDSCELCRTKIDITRKRKPLLKWKLPSQRPTPVLWVLVFITAIALNLASVIKDASRLCTSTPCLVFYAVGCVGVILGTLFLIYWSKRARIFIGHWIEQNEEWVVIISEDQQKIGETKKEVPFTKQADAMMNRSIIEIV